MCGITGFAERNHKAETARRIVKGMADLITYRGPDGEGYYVDDQVALGHRRLSIIDLEGGKQPMFNEDQNLAVIGQTDFQMGQGFTHTPQPTALRPIESHHRADFRQAIAFIDGQAQRIGLR